MLQAVSDVPRWLSVPSLNVLAFIHIHTHSSPSYIFMCIIIIMSRLGDCWPAVVGPRGFILWTRPNFRTSGRAGWSDEDWEYWLVPSTSNYQRLIHLGWRHRRMSFFCPLCCDLCSFVLWFMFHCAVLYVPLCCGLWSWLVECLRCNYAERFMMPFDVVQYFTRSFGLLPFFSCWNNMKFVDFLLYFVFRC